MAGTVERRVQVQIKRALLLIVVGLIVELFCVVHITPPTFLLFAFFGAGPVVVGLALFVVAVIRSQRVAGQEGEGG
ncbi:MAG: hypothetical protein R6X02_30965 [Enhygromyxa sp.]